MFSNLPPLSRAFEIIVLAIACFAVAGCASHSSQSAAGAAPTGKTWALKTLDGKDVVVAQGKRRPDLRLDATENRASGFAGVNRFTGPYTLDGQNLKFGPLGMTRMAGEPADMDLEQRYAKALGATTAWRMADETLELLAGDRVVAQFELTKS
jgi:heat shock protein HslJ